MSRLDKKITLKEYTCPKCHSKFWQWGKYLQRYCKMGCWSEKERSEFWKRAGMRHARLAEEGVIKSNYK